MSIFDVQDSTRAPATTSSLAMQTLSQYRIVRKLGAGGMGDVYLAQDISLNRYVALKFLPPDALADPERLDRFRQEAQIASAINHPNILTIHAIGVNGADHFIVSEFVDGETLRTRIDRGPLPIREAVAIGCAVADALRAAHLYWVIHRDLKPENVMIREDGWVKILDFGLAKLTEPSVLGSPQVMTTPGLVPGSVRYVAPERLRGEAADPRTDIFGLGTVLYEVLTRKPPFHAPSLVATIQAVLNDDPAPPRMIRDDVPPELEQIILRCLRKIPGERFQTASEAFAALDPLRRRLDFEAL